MPIQEDELAPRLTSLTLAGGKSTPFVQYHGMAEDITLGARGGVPSWYIVIIL